MATSRFAQNSHGILIFLVESNENEWIYNIVEIGAAPTVEIAGKSREKEQKMMNSRKNRRRTEEEEKEPMTALSTRCRSLAERQRAVGGPETDSELSVARLPTASWEPLPRGLEPAVGGPETDSGLSVIGPATGTYFSNFLKMAYIL